MGAFERKSGEAQKLMRKVNLNTYLGRGTHYKNQLDERTRWTYNLEIFFDDFQAQSL